MTDQGLHTLARLLLRVCSPRRVHAILSYLGGFLPPHVDRDDLLRAERRMRGRGSCLSRGLAVAARAPHADLVIGVAPPARAGFFAHAWLELAGEPIDHAEVAGDEIARFRSRRPEGSPRMSHMDDPSSECVVRSGAHGR